jgi:3-dehydroquinate synthase
VQIHCGVDRYCVLIGTGLLEQFVNHANSYFPSKSCVIISDSNVARLFGKHVKKSLTAAGFHPMLIVIPAGEKSKTLQRVGAICDQMIAAGIDRQSFVVGLGGGMIGDLSGFVAAIYHRGIPHIQIPTTLLAMVDSSIGGKTGVDMRAGKNLIGAFHQPSLVIDDVDVLKTLPPRQFTQGFAEIIKHAVIADTKMFRQLEVAHVSSLRRARDTRALLSLIQRNIKIKSSIVAKDERDRTGKRALLNFGHTIGHAIERAGNYSKFLHGEAVSLGMVAACAISLAKARLPPAQRDAIVSLLKRLGLPTRLPPTFPRRKILDAVKMDKKFEGGKIRFVLIPRVGKAYVADNVTLDDIREAINQL